MRTIFALLLVSMLIACGDDDGGTDAATVDTGGSDTGGTDSGDDSGGDDAGDDDAGDLCAGAVEDEPCTAEGTSCGGELCTDECSFCNILRCEAGTWERLEAFPAPCFSCGDELQCPQGTDYCNTVIGGPAGSEPSYSCVDLPEACRAEPTCDCLGTEGVAGDCVGEGDTGLTVTIAAP